MSGRKAANDSEAGRLQFIVMNLLLKAPGIPTDRRNLLNRAQKFDKKVFFAILTKVFFAAPKTKQSGSPRINSHGTIETKEGRNLSLNFLSFALVVQLDRAPDCGCDSSYFGNTRRTHKR